jgi:cyclopropane fatty-acyl-phospholipid synthase-like methyltransferase
MNKWIYELLYRIPFIPISWIFGSSHEMEKYRELIESGRIPPGRAIDLGCGEGSNAIYLSKSGFDVTGVDFSHTAIKRATSNVQAAGVEVTFVEDDLTNLRHVSGAFDLLVDFGALNDLNQEDRDLYMQNVLPLTIPGSHYVLLCFENKLDSEEVQHRFSEYFMIESLTKRSESVTARGIAVYLMIRN